MFIKILYCLRIYHIVERGVVKANKELLLHVLESAICLSNCMFSFLPVTHLYYIDSFPLEFSNYMIEPQDTEAEQKH